MIRGHTTDESGPESLRHKVRQPEPVQGRVVEALHTLQCQHVTQDIVRLGVGGLLQHEGGDDHLVMVDLQGHLKLLQEADVAILHLCRGLCEQTTDLCHTYTQGRGESVKAAN